MNRNRQTGVSLVELMIGITIGLFLLIGVVSVFGNSNRVYTELNQASQQIENGRFAIQIMSDDVALAGFYGRYYGQLSVTGTPDPCEKDDVTALRNNGAAWGIQGYNAPGSSPITACLPSANHLPGTDILVVRRADTKVTATADLNASDIYVQANANPNDSSSPLVALGTAGNFTLVNKDNTPAPIRKLHVHVYFVAPCSVPAGGGTVCTGSADDGGSPIPTLKRLELGIDLSDNTRKMVVTPLVEGIENLQIDYGIDSDGDGAPNGAYVATTADWQNVVAVRLHVLARNLQKTGDYTDAKKYDMGVAFPSGYAPGGNFKRHVYNAVVRLVNPSARRDT